MQNYFERYISDISAKFAHSETSEMGYRTDFENLIKHIFEQINVRRIDHDPRASKGNKPDFIVLNNDVPILYIEVKNIGESLDKIEKSEQMSRYYGYENLVLTDYVEFRFYRNGELYEDPIKVANVNQKNRTLTSLPQNYDYVARTLVDFTLSHKEPIRRGEHLAQIMGGKAQRIRENVIRFLGEDKEQQSELFRVYETIKKLLVHDLTQEAFADMYAQTLVYGLFVARYYDETGDSFTRQEARDLIPDSNPLLRHFFDHITGASFDTRLEYIVDELCEVFSHADVHNLMNKYFENESNNSKEGPDPVIHYYEDFLKKYDPQLRKKLGAFYTPLPVVRFIVRAVDDILKKDFKLPLGLADTTKINGIHKVQILDPAVGTGTFISAIIRQIYGVLRQNGQEGRWTGYVHYDLLPRLHGFELMMTSYTIAHLKLSMAFKQTGFWKFHRRLGIYLTNSLEIGTNKLNFMPTFGFADSITEEAKAASKIKNETPVMVVMGNPPYSVSSSNKGEWIQNLIKDYKNNLVERNIQPLSDDYIKFIRFAEHFIEKNESGIVAMITNNSFLDGVIHRQMRRHLLETFDDIYILDLHGNSKKNEVAPDGSKDDNVFDIQQGVSINIFVKNSSVQKNLAKVHHSDLYGKRALKFEFLNKNSLKSIDWQEVQYSEPYYFFVPKDFSRKEEYDEGVKIDELFIESGSGVKFRKDNLLVKKHFVNESVQQMLEDMSTLSNADIYSKYDIQDTSDWKLDQKRRFFQSGDYKNIRPVFYRPFDIRYTYYPLDQIGELIPRGDSRRTLMKHFIQANVGLSLMRGLVNTRNYTTVSVVNSLMELNFYGFQTYVFPMYVYNSDGVKISNLNVDLALQFLDGLSFKAGNEHILLKFKNESTEPDRTITQPYWEKENVYPIDIFDYIYAILHSKTYREKYKEFIKIDFPRIPKPTDATQFWRLVELGMKLRRLHLLESIEVSNITTTFPMPGSDTVDKKIEYKDGKVFINDTQYFGNVSEIAWDFLIGGYQPAQKWLNDRRGRVLTNEDIEYYQKIIVSLVETDKLMKQIDEKIDSHPSPA